MKKVFRKNVRSWKRDGWLFHLPAWAAYIFALAATLVTLLFRMQFEVFFVKRPLLILFMLPIILSAYVGGLWTGLLATLTAALSVDFFLVPPVYSLRIGEIHDLVQWLILILCGVLVSVLNESLHRSREQALRSTTAYARAERELQTSDARYRAIVEAVPDLLFEIARDGIILDYSAPEASVLYVPPEEFIGRNVLQVLPEPVAQTAIENGRKALDQKEMTTFEYELPIPGGQRVYEDRVMPLTENSTLSIIRDITQQKQLERAIRLVSETQRQIVHLDRLPEIFELVGTNIQKLIGDSFVAISILDEDIQAMRLGGLYGFGGLYDALTQKFKFDPLQFTYALKDMTPAELAQFRSGKLEKFEGGLYRLLLEKIPRWICEMVERELGLDAVYTMGFAWKDLHFGGVTILAKQDLAPFKEMIETIVNQATITIKRIRSENALRESEKKYRDLINSMNDTVWVIDFDTTILDVNHAATVVLGYTREELLSMKIPDIDTELKPEQIQNLASNMPRDKVQVFETYHSTKDGRKLPVEISSSLVSYSGKTVIVSIARDITERKHAQEKIEQHTRELEALQATILDIASPHILPELLRLVVERTCTLLNTSSGGLYLCDAEQQVVRCVVSYNTIQDYTGILLKFGEGAAGQVAQTGEPLIIDNYQTWSGRAAVYEPDHSFDRVMSVPMKWEGQVIGVIHALRTGGAPFNRDELNLLKLFADHAAVVVEQARLRDSLERELAERKQAEEALRRRETLLNEMGRIARIGGWELDVATMKQEWTDETYAIHDRERGIYDPDSTEEISRFEPGSKELIGKAFEDALGQGRPYDLEVEMTTVKGNRKWVRAVCSPLLVDGKVTKLTGAVQDITERKQAEETIRRQFDYLTALQEIDRFITSNFDLQVILNQLVSRVTSKLRVDAAAVLLFEPYSNMLAFASGHGFRGTSISRLRLRLGEDYAGEVALTHRAVHIRDLSTFGRKLSRPEWSGEDFVAYHALPLVAKGKLEGVLEIFHRSALDPDEEQLNFMAILAEQAAIAIDNVRMFEKLQRSNFDLVLAYDATIAGWSQAMDIRDKESEGHTRRVTELTERLAKRMNVSSSDQVHIRRGALLHDIGKLGVPDHILLKAGPLTDEEWKIMRQHPSLALDMLGSIHYLQPALDIPYCHHEKWDGTGYPRGLKGEQIPLAARLFAVVDVWDAMRSDRPYRAGVATEETRRYILEQSGKHFDPRVVDAFLSLLNELGEK